MKDKETLDHMGDKQNLHHVIDKENQNSFANIITNPKSKSKSKPNKKRIFE